MLKLERIEDKVYYNGIELKINKQASKGAGNEVVDISKLPEANGQKWISLNRLKDGINEIECKAREITTSKKYELTDDEKSRIAELQSEIDAIIEKAKARYVAKPNLNVNVAKMTAEEKAAYIVAVQNYLASLNA